MLWSNQCIEYWFVLHFDFYQSDNHREAYIDYLNGKFKSLGLNGYKKNDAAIFHILYTHGDPKQAILYAKRRITECKEKTNSDSAPATKVHMLVEALSNYLPDEMKHCFI